MSNTQTLALVKRIQKLFVVQKITYNEMRKQIAVVDVDISNMNLNRKFTTLQQDIRKLFITRSM